MTKVYILTERDFDYLLARIDRDSRHGQDGGSSASISPAEQSALDEAHRFYNYQIRGWIQKVKE